MHFQSEHDDINTITDNPYHRMREYNVGEREVADLLISLGCFEIAQAHMSIWAIPQN